MKSMLLFLLIFLLAFSSLIGLSIRGSVLEETRKIKESTSTGIKFQRAMVEADLIFDMTKNEKGEIVRTYKLPLLKESIYEDILRIPGVAGGHINDDCISMYTGLKTSPAMYAEILDEIDSYEPAEEAAEVEKNARIFSGSVQIYPVEEGEYHPYFINGALEILKGRNIEKGDTNEVIISEDYARRNHLKLGDYFTGKNYDAITNTIYGKEIKFEVVGIFRINFEQEVPEYTWELGLLKNSIFTSSEVITFYYDNWYEYYKQDRVLPLEDPLISDATIYVENPELLPEIEKKIMNMQEVDWSYYDISYYDQDYKAIAKPLLTMQKLINISIVVFSVGTLVILSLILGMWIQSRQHEFNILHNIGIEKRSIWLQLMLESGCLSVVAFLGAVILAKPMNTVIGNRLLHLLTPQTTGQAYTADLNAYSEIIINRTPVKTENLRYSLSPEMVFTVLGIVLTVVLISVTIAFFRNSRKS